MAAAAQPTEPTVSRTETVGLGQVATAFPHLHVLEMIGQGGMGSVFKVRQPKLDRFAALKLLPQSLATDPAFAGRFEREARLLAKLSHPNIVAVYDYGQAGNFFYLLMEFVDGVNLRQAMRASRFEPRQALGIVPKICEALQYAHDEGVLHRDIKPENILLDTRGRLKLVDFGIAKLTAEADVGHANAPASDTTFTQAGVALGTPSYMAPEQRDHPADVDHRADIYSLGVVFYELLTGELPNGSIARPSEKSSADPRVDAIVQQTLEKERDRRQHSANEVRTQVETITSSPHGPIEEKRSTQGPVAEPRFSRVAIIGAAWSSAFFVVLAMLHVSTTGPQVPPNWQLLLRFTLLPAGLLAPLGTTVLGWIAVAQIRRSGGRLYGLGLAVFDGLIFPLLTLDGVLVWVSKLSFNALFPEFYDGGGIVTLPTGKAISLESLALVVALAISALVDLLIIWRTWRALTKTKALPPFAGRDQTTPGAPLLANIAALFWGMSGLVSVVAWLKMPQPPQVVVWAILASAILAVALAIPVRTSRLGFKSLIGGTINIAVWLIIFAIFATVYGGGHGAAAVQSPLANFRCRVFAADAALIDKLIPVNQRKPVQSDIQSALATNAATAFGKRSIGDFTVTTKGDTLTEAQVAAINPDTVGKLLQSVDREHDLWVDQTRSVSTDWWHPGLPDSWSYSHPQTTRMIGGGAIAFLGFRHRGGQDEIHIDCRVDHEIDLIGKSGQTGLTSILLYEGPVPPAHELVFLVPYFEQDDSPHYLVVAYNIGEGTEQVPDANLSPPSVATTTPAAKQVFFGPVTQRTLPEPAVGAKCFLNLAGGEPITPPEQIAWDFGPEDKSGSWSARYYGEKAAEMQPWPASSGADVMAVVAHTGIPDNDRGLTLFDGLALGTVDWDSATPEQIAKTIRAAEEQIPKITPLPMPMCYMRVGNDLPKAFAFKTRGGSIGILQITGLTAIPQAVTFRYKFVTGGFSAQTQRDITTKDADNERN